MSRKSFVYFFSAPGRIKIGVTGDVEKRRLAVGSHMDAPPTLLGFVEGDGGGCWYRGPGEGSIKEAIKSHNRAIPSSSSLKSCAAILSGSEG